MKNSIIAILIGALLVLIFQALSWMVSPIHANSHKYTPMEDSLLTAMQGLTTGVYYLPGEPEGATMDEMKAKHEASIGKPWAIIYYHEALEMNMLKNIGLAFLINIIVVWFLVWILKTGNITAKSKILSTSMVVSVIIVFSAFIMQWNWFYTPTHNLIGDIIDQLIAGLILGVWLGYYFNRKAKA